MNLSVRNHTNPHEFFKNIKHILEGREAEYGLLHGLLESAQSNLLQSPPIMLECKKNDKAVAAAMVAGLHLVLTEGAREFSKQMIEHLEKSANPIPGVIGPVQDAEEFAKVWSSVKKCAMKLAMNQRVYQLTKVDFPSEVPGRARLVTEKDIPLLSKWIEEFYKDALPWEIPSKEKILQMAELRIPQRMTYFWEDGDQAVSMAALARPTQKGITINLVYTPPEYRKKGYASAVVAAVSAEGLKKGKDFCVLYTDLNNPTSNRIYQNVGYRPVVDSKNFIFED